MLFTQLEPKLKKTWVLITSLEPKLKNQALITPWILNNKTQNATNLSSLRSSLKSHTVRNILNIC